MMKMNKVNTFWAPLYDYANILALLFIAIGLFYSRALLSMGMIGLLLNAFLTFPLKQLWSDYKSDKLVLLMSLFFWTYLVSGCYSSDLSSWFSIMIMKVPFLALPFVLLSNDNRSKHIKIFFIAFCGILFLSSMPIIIEFFSDINGALLKYQRGHTLKTPIDHVRYSLFLSVSVFISIHFAIKYFKQKRKVLSIGLVLFGAYLFLFTHLLAVRSGLVCMYIGLFVYMIIYVIKYRYWKMLFVGSLLMMGFVLIAPRVFPTLDKKIGYTLYDLSKLKQNEIGQNSDSKRLISIIVGWEIFKENPFFGVGAGDLVPSVNDIYQERFSSLDVKSRLLPHNQFLRVVNSVGLTGLLLMLCFLFLPIFKKKGGGGNPLFVAFILSVTASFFVEGTIENQIGTAYFLIFYFSFYKNRNIII